MVCTVAISTCNSAEFFRCCLDQLCKQSLLDDFEVIVIDSGSDENESAICERYTKRFAALTCVRTPRETLYSAWNRALGLAKGRYFINANTDDSLHPNALRLLVTAMDTRPEFVLAYGDWLWATTPNAPYPWDSSFRRCVHEEYHPSLPLFYAYAGCHQFWRTEKLRELGGFDASYTAAGDYEALCRMTLKHWQAVYIPEVISAFYQNPRGLSRSSCKSSEEFNVIRDRFRSRVSIEYLYDVDADSPSDCARAWTDLARRALSLHVPWAEQATPDYEFAAACARRALTLDPEHKPADQLLRVAKRRHSGIFSRSRRLVERMFPRSKQLAELTP